jgi:hypothetical protein
LAKANVTARIAEKHTGLFPRPAHWRAQTIGGESRHHVTTETNHWSLTIMANKNENKNKNENRQEAR